MRASRVKGRFFSNRYEQKRIDRHLSHYQEEYGNVVLWYFLDRTESTYSDIYDESIARVFNGPRPLPVLSAIIREGDQTTSEDGLYTLDVIDVRASYEQLRRSGIDVNTGSVEKHLVDRFTYKRRVFAPREISPTGQFAPDGRDMIVRIVGVRVRPDELVTSPQFNEATFTDQP